MRNEPQSESAGGWTRPVVGQARLRNREQAAAFQSASRRPISGTNRSRRNGTAHPPPRYVAYIRRNQYAMENNKITEIYIRTYRSDPKIVIHRDLDFYHDQYDLYRFRDQIDIVKKLIEILDQEFDNFLESFLNIDLKYFNQSRNRKRHYIAKNREELYPSRASEFLIKYSYSYKDYWIGTNIGATEIRQYVKEMCEACEITYKLWYELKF